MFRKHIFTLALVALAHIALGQSANSPYSIFGLGDDIQRGNVANAGMGGVGYAYAHPFFSTAKNPALLPVNILTVFDAGYSGERKWLNTVNESTSTDQSQRDVAGNLNYLSLTFPVMPRGPRGSNRHRWNMSLGLRPTSLVNYDFSFSSREGLENTEAFANYEYTGDGGLNEVHWSHGVQLLKQLSVGLDFNYVFGTINRSSTTYLENTSTLYQIELKDRTIMSDLSVGAGIAFTDSLYTNPEKGHRYTYSLGGVFRPGYELNTLKTLTLNTKDDSEASIINDTIQIIRDNLTMPTQIGGGIAISKVYSPKSHFSFTLGMDATYTQWSSYVNNFTDDEPGELEDVLDLAVGLEVVPDAGSVSNYLNRIIYRAGARYTTTPWALNGSTLNEYQLSVGASFPLLRQASAISLAAIYGWRGESAAGSIKEDYIRIKCGITINDRWFVKRKYF